MPEALLLITPIEGHSSLNTHTEASKQLKTIRDKNLVSPAVWGNKIKEHDTKEPDNISGELTDEAMTRNPLIGKIKQTLEKF